MNTPLYVRAAHHEVLPARGPRRQPRQRFVEYQQDLHRIAGLTLDLASLTRGDQYTYVELADTLLSNVGGECLRDIDVLVTSYWTPEFDPDISAFGPYLHHRYSLTCESFDLIDQGSISPVLALLVLGEYLRAGEQPGDGVLLGVEQSTVPMATGANVPTPSRSSAGLVRLSRRPADRGTAVLAVANLSEERAAGHGFGIAELAESFGPAGRELVRHDGDGSVGGPELGNLTLAIRRNTFLYRKWARQAAAGSWPCRVRFLPAENSCMGLFEWLSAVSAGEYGENTHVIFADEDVESLTAAAVLAWAGAR